MQSYAQKIYLGLRSGYNLANGNLSTSYAFNTQRLPIIGGVFGLNAHILLGEHLGLQTEVGLVQKGYNQVSSYNIAMYNLTLSIDVIDVPLLLTYKHAISNKFNITALAGPSFGYIYQGLVYGTIFIGGAPLSSGSMPIDFKDTPYVRVDLAANAGLELSYALFNGFLFADARYQVGILKFVRDFENRYYNEGYQFTLGYRYLIANIIKNKNKRSNTCYDFSKTVKFKVK